MDSCLCSGYCCTLFLFFFLGPITWWEISSFGMFVPSLWQGFSSVIQTLSFLVCSSFKDSFPLHYVTECSTLILKPDNSAPLPDLNIGSFLQGKKKQGRGAWAQHRCASVSCQCILNVCFLSQGVQNPITKGVVEANKWTFLWQPGSGKCWKCS